MMNFDAYLLALAPALPPTLPATLAAALLAIAALIFGANNINNRRKQQHKPSSSPANT